MKDKSVTSSAPLLTPAGVAKDCQVSRKTVYRWIRGGDLLAIRLGNMWRIRQQDYDDFIKANAWEAEE